MAKPGTEINGNNPDKCRTTNVIRANRFAEIFSSSRSKAQDERRHYRAGSNFPCPHSTHNLQSRRPTRNCDKADKDFHDSPQLRRAPPPEKEPPNPTVTSHARTASFRAIQMTKNSQYNYIVRKHLSRAVITKGLGERNTSPLPRPLLQPLHIHNRPPVHRLPNLPTRVTRHDLECKLFAFLPGIPRHRCHHSPGRCWRRVSHLDAHPD